MTGKLAVQLKPVAYSRALPSYWKYSKHNWNDFDHESLEPTHMGEAQKHVHARNGSFWLQNAAQFVYSLRLMMMSSDQKYFDMSKVYACRTIHLDNKRLLSYRKKEQCHAHAFSL